MKKLTIGRNNACDIVVPDNTDLVSRKQAVLTYTFWGKMVLYDTSNNGTYINGKRLANGKGCQVTRKDNINFAHVCDFDWNTVKDPYRRVKAGLLLIPLAVVIVALAIMTWHGRNEETAPIVQPVAEQPIQRGQTTTTVEPQPSQSKPKSKKRRQKNSNNKEKKQDPIVTPQDIADKEVQQHVPIVY